MTQKEQIKALEAEIALLKARLAAVEARPVYYPYWQPQPQPWSSPFTYQTTWNSGGMTVLNSGGMTV